jgi:hypothetical protein
LPATLRLGVTGNARPEGGVVAGARPPGQLKGILEVDLAIDQRQRANRTRRSSSTSIAGRFDVDHHVATAIVRAPQVRRAIAARRRSLLLPGCQRKAWAFLASRTVGKTRSWSELIIEFQARLQLARLPESFFEDAPLDLVQFVRPDQIVAGAPVLLLEMLVPQTQQLNEVETLETRRQSSSEKYSSPLPRA